jgi:hypothetical protein
METLDRVFEVIFARWRRKLGDSNIEAAWRRASNKVSTYLLFPIAAITGVLMAVVFSFMGTGTFAEHKRAAQIVGVMVWIAISVLLDRRFKKYLLIPPRLPPDESSTDRQFVFWFHVISIGVFVITCLSGYFLHRGGLRLL